MIIVNTSLPKACWANPGDVVQIPKDDTGEPEGPLYLVCTIPQDVATTMRIKASSPKARMAMGLYAEDRPLWLVNLETGEGMPMPHLSSRCRIIRDATLTFSEPDEHCGRARCSAIGRY